LEHGTRPHKIRPRRAEAIDTPEGARAEPITPAPRPIIRSPARWPSNDKALCRRHHRPAEAVARAVPSRHTRR
jgi:hypothetical protein